jgi:hypothetical protein
VPLGTLQPSRVRFGAVLAGLGGREAMSAGGALSSRLPDREILHGIGRGTSELPIPPNTGRSADGDPVAGTYATADGRFPVVCGVCARPPARPVTLMCGPRAA